MFDRFIKVQRDDEVAILSGGLVVFGAFLKNDQFN